MFLHWSASGYDAFIIGILLLTVEQLLIVAAPPQAILVKIMFDQRVKGVKITDARVRLITEVSHFLPQSYPSTRRIQVLQGIRLVKLYGWEDFYVERIQEMRTREVKTIRKSA